MREEGMKRFRRMQIRLEMLLHKIVRMFLGQKMIRQEHRN